MNFKFVDIRQADKAVQEKVREWRNHQDIRQWMFSQHIISKEEHAQWLQNLNHHSDTTFWVVYVNDALMGVAYLQEIDLKDKTTEWGFYIGESRLRGQGLGRAFLFHILEKIFDEMGFRTLITRVFSRNKSALKLYTKFHFTEKQRHHAQSPQEVIVFEIGASTWSRVRNELKPSVQGRVESGG